ncbi:MAG: hypothetical protein L0Y80_13390 [Ignavibacteriae bacterium]|nr:hypothetical protein [Ignavibacteriota bacterium]
MTFTVQPREHWNTTEPLVLRERYYVLTAFAFAGIYFGLSYLSDGFFQDDEIEHFFTAYEFWDNPLSIVTSWSRPGFKIFYVLPALFGIKGMHFAASFIAGGTAYLASLLAREYGVKNRVLALVLCGFQPLFYQLSFRTYAEIIAAFLLVLMLICYQRKRYILAAFISSYLFSVRHELVVLSLVLGVFFLWRREWLAFLMLGWMPVFLNILGWFKTGDQLWVLNAYLMGGKNIGFSKPGFFQYVTAATPIFGVIIIALALAGMFGFFAQPKHTWKARLERYHALYITFLAVLLMNSVLASETLNISSGQGVWRHILTVSPVVAVFAAMGFNMVWSNDARLRFSSFGIMALYSISVLIFFSQEHNYYRLLPAKNYLGFLVLLGFIYTFLVAHKLQWKTRTVLLFTVGLTVLHTIAAEKPLRLSDEGKTIRDVIAFYNESGFRYRVTAAQHPMFYLLAHISDRWDPQYPRTSLEVVRNLPPGAVVIWDSHYTYRPEWSKRDAHLDSLMADRTLKPLRSFRSDDKWFYAIVFEKTAQVP